jgi:hypothetical protein
MLRSMTLPELVMWQHYYGEEPWGALDAVVASLGQHSATAGPSLSVSPEETPEQIEARIMQEMGIR